MADAPTSYSTIDNGVSVEPLRGPVHPHNLLDRFPDEVYNKNVDSTLVKFMNALLGPSGAGWIRKNYAEVRLLFEQSGVQLEQLERFYGDPFRFGRIADEKYSDETTGGLDRETWNIIKTKDEAYRNRVIDFFHAARLGSTPDGVGLAARSGLGYGVQVFENYNYLFDQHSDSVIGMPSLGGKNLEEFVIFPSQEFSKTSVQTIKFQQPFDSGYFTLSFNGESTSNTPQSYSSGTIAQSGYLVTGSGTVFTQNMVNGRFVTGSYVGTVLEYIDSATIRVSYSATVGATASYQITYGGLSNFATSLDVLNALSNLSSIGIGNVSVSGNLTNGFVVQFTGLLSNTLVSTIEANSQLTLNSVIKPITVTASFLNQPNDETVNIPSINKHAANTAIDLIKPVNTFASYKPAQSLIESKTINDVYAHSQYNEVIRHIRGSDDIVWPTVDSVYWIEAGIEKQAPRVFNDLQQHYQNFHTPSSISTYTDEAVTQNDYLNSNYKSVIDNTTYKSENVGNINTDFVNLVGKSALSITGPKPILNSTGDTVASGHIYAKEDALPSFAEPPLVTSQADYSGVQFINGIYPVGDKMESVINNITTSKNYQNFWASKQRESKINGIATSEYLEIDFGSPVVINFIALEVFRLPIDIEITYDDISNGVTRRFVDPVKEEFFPWDTSLYFDSNQKNVPWESLTYNFTDNYGEIPFTRFVRIKFTRRDDFATSSWSDKSWPIIARNIRMGRNV